MGIRVLPRPFTLHQRERDIAPSEACRYPPLSGGVAGARLPLLSWSEGVAWLSADQMTEEQWFIPAAEPRWRAAKVS